MPKQQSQKKRGGMRKFGRGARKPKNAKYTSNRQREKNKLKRVLQSCGENEAFRWAQVNDIVTYYHKLVA